MKESEIFVVIGTDLGWDCLVGVFDGNKVSLEDLKKEFPPKDNFYIYSTSFSDLDAFND